MTAFISQDMKKELMPDIKKVLKKYNVKATARIEGLQKLVVCLKQGSIDFNADAIRNEWTEGKDIHSCHSIQSHRGFNGKAKQFLVELFQAMNHGNHDNSDVQTDYFDVGWYTGVEIGYNFENPYEVK